MGQPEMEEIWEDLSARRANNSLAADEEKFFKKLVKTSAISPLILGTTV